MDIISVKGLSELTQELLEQRKISIRAKTHRLSDQLWSVIDQELLRYSCTVSDDCEVALRQLVAAGVANIGQSKTSARIKGLFGPADPEVVIAPYVYPHIQTKPPRYLIYGLQMHRNQREELAEIAIRTVVLTMIRIAKEGESDELTIQTFGSVKKLLCPLWPFWKREEC